MAAVLAMVLGMPFWLRAFPPAPPYRISGLVRDEYGSPVSTLGAMVVLQASNGVQISASIVPLLAPGLNYNMTVPMDFGTPGQLYKGSALFPATPYLLSVIIGYTTNVPIQMASGLLILGQPADSTNIDLTLGTDSVGDGLPDAWKDLVVAMFGGLVKFGDIHPWSIPPNGGQSYGAQFLAGTFPWENSETFKLIMVNSNGQTLRLQWPTILDHTYTISSSVDLLTWTPVNFTLSGSSTGTPPMSAYYAKDNSTIQVDVAVPAGQLKTLYFRGQVQ
jgi:hypothetical protein